MDQFDRPSKKQRELLSFIDGFIKGYGYGPSYREIMRALNYKSVSTVSTHVEGLIAKGFLIKKDNSARSLVVVDSTNMPHTIKPVTKTQQKWLIDQISRRIDEYSDAPTKQSYQDIQTLIQTLRILGFIKEADFALGRYKELAPPA